MEVLSVGVAKEKSEKGEESRFGNFHHGLNLEKEGGGVLTGLMRESSLRAKGFLMLCGVFHESTKEAARARAIPNYFPAQERVRGEVSSKKMHREAGV